MKKHFLGFIFVVVLKSVSGGSVFAATISLSPSKTSVLQGEAFTATVSVNTQGVAINNAEGTISFPASLVSVESVNLNGSIFNIWVEQPTYSNTNGTISFNGGLPNPGYTGSNGTVMRVVFRAKKTGSVPLTFSAADVYANDGLGTNVTSAKINAPIVQIITKVLEEEQPVEEEVSVKVPSVLRITSKQAPDPESWYNMDELTFQWDLPQGATGVQLGWGVNPLGTPTVSYSPPIRDKVIKDIPDGVWYIHARVRNSAGYGAVTHRKFKIDTVSPKDLVVNVGKDTDGSTIVTMSSTDDRSGIAQYSISVDGKTLGTVAVSATSNTVTYVLPEMITGRHSVLVTAADNAGNTTTQEVFVEGSGVKTPVITKYPQTIRKNEVIHVEGNAAPDAKIQITLTYIDNSIVKTVVLGDSSGNFTYDSGLISKTGVVKIHAEVINEEGKVIGVRSNSVSVSVEKQPFSLPDFPEISPQLISTIAIAIAILLLLGVIIGYFRLRVMHSRLRKDVDLLKVAVMKKSTTQEEIDAINKITHDLQ